MNHRHKLFLGVLVLLLVAMSCDIPIIGQIFSPAKTSTSIASHSTAPTATFVPLMTVVAKATQSTPVLPTPALKNVDLSQAKLLLTDLPNGYIELSEQEWSKIGVSKELVTAAFTGKSLHAQPSNFTVFRDQTPANIIVISFILSPLTASEISSFEHDKPDAALMQKVFGQGSTVTILPGANNIGDYSGGYAFYKQSSSQVFKGEMVVAHRDAVVLMTIIMGSSSANPGISAAPLARILDSRIKTALGIK